MMHPGDVSLLQFTAVSGSVSAALFAAVWQGTLLAALVELCLRLVPRVSAGVRSAVWMAVFLLVALLHFVPLAGSGANATVGTGERVFHADVRWSLAVVAVWAVLSGVRAFRLIASAVRLRGVAGRAVPVPVTEIPVRLAALCESARGRRVELCTTDEVDRPSVNGFFRPRILIPPALLASLSTAELEQILLHEMEHLRRGDDWTNLVQKIGLVLFPLNPVLVWVERRLCTERELACDDRVLHATGARKAYAACLANLAEHSVLRRGATLALRAWDRQSEVTRRVHRILARPEREMNGRQAKMVTAALVVGVLAVGGTLTRSPQLLAFTSVQQFSQASVSTTSPMQPVLHSGLDAPASMTLLRADMPEARAMKTALPKHARRSTAKNVVRNTVRRQIPQQQAVMTTLTEWQAAPSMTRVAYVVTDDSQASYAAVPTPGGWLIFQL